MRTAAINLRVMPTQRNLIDQAAELLGKTRSDFMVEVACSRAKDVILDQTLFQLEEERFNELMTILDAPLKPNPKLEKLMKRVAPWNVKPA